MIGARNRDRTCQEASVLSRETYIPCGRAAAFIVDNGDERPYWMCDACTDHNIRNRGAQLWIPGKPVAKFLRNLQCDVPYDPAEAHQGFAELEAMVARL